MEPRPHGAAQRSPRSPRSGARRPHLPLRQQRRRLDALHGPGPAQAQPDPRGPRRHRRDLRRRHPRPLRTRRGQHPERVAPRTGHRRREAGQRRARRRPPHRRGAPGQGRRGPPRRAAPRARPLARDDPRDPRDRDGDQHRTPPPQARRAGRDRFVPPIPRCGVTSSTRPCAREEPTAPCRPWSSTPRITYRRARVARSTSRSRTRACSTSATRSITGSCRRSPASASRADRRGDAVDRPAGPGP
jgi:hypothetical protein